MASHKATIHWKNTSDQFLKGKYSREHTWTHDNWLEAQVSLLVADFYFDQTRTVGSDARLYGAGDVGSALDPVRGHPH